MQPVTSAEITESGLTGDHGRSGKRALTLFQAEHMSVVASFLPVDNIAPETLRRNLHIAGLNLSALSGVPLLLGSALIEITIPCAPCSRMQTALGPGGYNALRGHGGWCAAVLRAGRVASDDSLARI